MRGGVAASHEGDLAASEVGGLRCIPLRVRALLRPWIAEFARGLAAVSGLRYCPPTISTGWLGHLER